MRSTTWLAADDDGGGEARWPSGELDDVVKVVDDVAGAVRWMTTTTASAEWRRSRLMADRAGGEGAGGRWLAVGGEVA